MAPVATFLFLDFDVVLHPEFCHESKHFCQLPVLEQALGQLPAVQIVISSTWRLSKSLDDLKRLFSAEIAARIVGGTPAFSQLDDVPDTLYAYQRETECMAWLRSHGGLAAPWIALDARSWLFRPFNNRVVLVDGRYGIQPRGAEKLIRAYTSA